MDGSEIMNELLPVGSVVSIKDFNNLLYIVCSANVDGEYDYLLAPYPSGISPLGFLRQEKKENILKVYFAGYIDIEKLRKNSIDKERGE